MVITYLLIGSNSGNREGHLEYARKELKKRAGRLLNASCIYETEPWGFESAQSFYNQALVIETLLPVNELFVKMLNIEDESGRIRFGDTYSDRTLDLDILFYGDAVINTDRLIVPHPRLHLRRFVLAPLAEIAPDYIHPVFLKTVAELLNECDDDSYVRKLLMGS